MTFALDIVDRGMVQRLHERSDIDNSGRAIVGHILHVQDVISRAANSAFKQHGLNYSVYVVLATLKASGTLYRMSLSKLVETLLLASGRISNHSPSWRAKAVSSASQILRMGRRLLELNSVDRVLVNCVMANHAAMERNWMKRSGCVG